MASEQQTQKPVGINAVIYATDFSKHSENAGQYARLLAHQLEAKLLVAHSFLLTQAAEEAELILKAPSHQREHYEALLIRRAGELAFDSINPAPVLLEGLPHESIPALAEKNAPAMIVLGTRGSGPVQHELLGSTAEKILRSTRRPCLTVGPKTPWPSPQTLPFQRILCVTDFTPEAIRAIVYALQLAQSGSRAIDVLHVVARPPDDPRGWAELRESYFLALDRLLPDRAQELRGAETQVEIGSLHDRILSHIREHRADLLVLGVRKSPHLDLEMRTSGVFRIIADALCPVLTITS